MTDIGEIKAALADCARDDFELAAWTDAFAGELIERCERAEGLLARLRRWDVMYGGGDGPYWISEIDAALGDQ